MKPFACNNCSNVLFFDNSRCLKCNAEVGYDRLSDSMVTWQSRTDLKRCSNGTEFGVCNWLLPVDMKSSLCLSCRFNRVIPDLTNAANIALWAKMESAKRRLVYSMLRIGLPVVNRAANPEAGLVFDFLEPTTEKPVLTGHDFGVITLNLQEADDAVREHNRQQLHEPYRTLLGHFRHEVGHYYLWLWLERDLNDHEGSLMHAFRQLFGDERTSYTEALQRHYEQGATPGWEQSFISAYATTHPWEDWAETWAHYLHLTDGLETTRAFGIDSEKAMQRTERFDPSVVALPAPFDKRDPDEFLNMLQRWSALTPALNEVSVSLGQRNMYPFVLNAPVARKLHYVHCLVRSMAELEALS
jgi:hypothetical protein